jgi:hypothetical protein
MRAITRPARVTKNVSPSFSTAVSNAENPLAASVAVISFTTIRLSDYVGVGNAVWRMLPSDLTLYVRAVHAVVNRLRLKSAIPPEVWERAQAEVPTRARTIPGFHALHIIEVSEYEVVLVVIAETAEALDRIANEIGNTWMRENVIPHLAAPPDRQVGRVVATSD